MASMNVLVPFLALNCLIYFIPKTSSQVESLNQNIQTLASSNSLIPSRLNLTSNTSLMYLTLIILMIWFIKSLSIPKIHLLMNSLFNVIARISILYYATTWILTPPEPPMITTLKSATFPLTGLILFLNNLSLMISK